MWSRSHLTLCPAVLNVSRIYGSVIHHDDSQTLPLNMTPYNPTINEKAVLDDGEKGDFKTSEFAVTAREDDTNVGLAAYEESKALGEIVSIFHLCYVVANIQTPEQNKRIRRKIDMFILPLFLLTQTLQFMDKTALNYAKVFGMEVGLLAR